MSAEFNLIQQYFTRPSPQTTLGVGDDAALINVTQGNQLAISADMLVAGTHFFADASAYHIGWKSLAVNISDMAAMGAQPKWATLALALPEINHEWLTEFSRGFFDCAKLFKVDLIGGDTTRGPLNICVQIMGEIPKTQALCRSGANIGDDIWVSGQLGDAALALAALQDRLKLLQDELAQCRLALEHPQPRVDLGLALRNIATSAIDISDGLLADLGHILSSSNKQAVLYFSRIPTSAVIQCYLDMDHVKNMLLAGGDDYELCFTAPRTMHQEIMNIGQSLNLDLNVIGSIIEEKQQATQIIVYDEHNQSMPLTQFGYDHFA